MGTSKEDKINEEKKKAAGDGAAEDNAGVPDECGCGGECAGEGSPECGGTQEAQDASDGGEKKKDKAALKENKVLKEENARLSSHAADLEDKYRRTLAEYDNFRKRTGKERDEIYPAATANAVAKFLPVLDNFQRAAAFPHPDDDFGKGFALILKTFEEVLAGLGVEEIGTVGETFDPALHNAVMHIEDETLGENVVSQVLQKGYKIGDRIIRYAMVQTAN